MRIPYFVAIIIILTLTNCNQRYQYIPNTLATPYVTEKGGGSVTASFSGTSNNLSGDLKAAYNPTKHSTLMLNYFRTRTTFSDYDFVFNRFDNGRVNGQLIELGGGGHISSFLGTSALYVGGGIGNTHNEYSVAKTAELRLNRFFIQPTFTFKNDWVRLGMGVRFVYLNFASGSVDLGIDPQDLHQIKQLVRDNPFWLTEFGGNLGFNLNGIILTGSIMVTPSIFDYENGFIPLNINAGISYEFTPRRKKEAK